MHRGFAKLRFSSAVLHAIHQCLLQPQAGQLLVDDTRITPINAGAWQRATGYVPQHIYLAEASVPQNIAFGVPNE